MARVAQRARLFAAARRHSMMVRLLRVLLPITAVVLLGGYAAKVMLNWQLSAGKFKLDNVVITADDLTMKNPSYFDVTSDGRYEVRAERAIVTFGQHKDTPIKLIDVSGEMVKKNGDITRLKAKRGLFDNAKGELELLDGIEIDGSNGMMARLTRAMIYSKEGRVVSTDPVSANMPTGSIQAGSMAMNTKTKLVQFRGQVSVRLVPQQGQTLGAGKDARRPVDIRSEELDIDDAAKTAHFRGHVVAMQGETLLQAPYLMVKYEGKAGAMAGMATAPAAGQDTAGKGTAGNDKDGGARVTFLWARNGVEVISGPDRRIVSELADFDVAGETALFDGNVVATQEKNVLKGGRLSIDRKAGKTRLETPGGGRIHATFLPPDSARQAQPGARSQAADEAGSALMGSFKAERGAPLTVEATLLELLDASNKATFTGDVSARQGDLLLRTSRLTAFYSGKAGLGLTEVGDAAAAGGHGSGREARKGAGQGAGKSEITRLEARQSVIITSKDQSATADWADFDVKGNTALLGGGVVVDKLVEGAEDPLKRNIVTGDRLRMDLTTGISQFESNPVAAARKTPVPTLAGDQGGSKSKGPGAPPGGPARATAGSTPQEKMRACPPGRQCGLIFPEQVKKRAIDVAKKKAPGFNVPQ